MSDRKVKVSLTAEVSGYLAGMDKAAKATEDMTEDAKKRLAEQQSAMTELGGTMMKFGAVAAVGLGLAGKAAVDWESDWAGVTKTVDGTPQQLNELEDSLRGLALQMPATAGEIAGVAEAAGQLGIGVEDVEAFTKTMIDLGETTNLTSTEAATSLARFSNIMGTSSDDVSNLGSAIVGLGNNYATTEAEIVAMSLRLAGSGAQMGLTEGEVFGLATAMSSVGIEAEAGGTAMSLTMKRIAKEVETGGDKLDTFASVAGMTSSQFASAWEDDAASALAAFVEGLGNAESLGMSTNAVLAELGVTGIREADALLRLSSAQGLMNDAMKQGNVEYQANNALADEAAKRYETVESQLKITANAVNEAGIQFGSVLLPAISDTAEATAGFATLIAGMPEPVKALVIGVGGLTVGVGLLGGGMLSLVPKIAATRTAMAQLNITSGTVAKGLGKGGGLMLAIAGIAGALQGADSIGTLAEDDMARLNAAVKSGNFDSLNDEFQNANGYASDFETTLNTMFGGNFWTSYQGGPAQINGALKAMSFGLIDLGAWADTAKAKFAQFGEGLGSMARDDLGAAQTQFNEFLKQTDGSEESVRQLLEAFPAYEAALRDLAAAKGVDLDQQELLNAATGDGWLATYIATDATKDNTAVLNELSGAAEDAGSEVSELSDIIRGFASTTLSARDAERQFESAVDDATAAFEANGNTLDVAEEAGRANEAALDAIARAALESAAATYEQTGSQEDATEAINRGRDALIEQLARFGITGDAAEAYADELGLIPSNVGTVVKLDTSLATAQLRNWLTLASGNTVRIAMGAGGSGGMTMADGGAVTGRGGPREDNIPIMASVGEHMLDAEDVKRLGGQAGVYALRESLYKPRGYADGGAVQYAPRPYASAGGGSGSGSGPVSVTITAPAIETQDPLVYGTIIGREFARRLAG